MTRWPNPPPRGQHCDAYKGCPDDCSLHHDPHIHRCQNLAVETVRPVAFSVSAEMWLCEECLDGLLRKQQVYRNPRKYGSKEQQWSTIQQQ